MDNNKIIFNVCQDSEFFGREVEIDKIYNHATSMPKQAYGIYLAGKRWIGKTELLRRIYHRLFWDQDKIVPIYYRFKYGCNIEDFSADYIMDFIKQYVAFLTKRPEIVTENISINKLEHLLEDMELSNISKFLTLHREGIKYGDKIAILRNAISAPHQIAVDHNTPIFLMLDDFNPAARTNLYKESLIISKEYIKTLMSGSVSYLITGCAGRLFEDGISPSSIKVMELTGLSEESSIRMMEAVSERYNINCDSEILAVAARQLDGNPVYIKSIMTAAKKEEKSLTTLKDFVDIYMTELTEGSIGFSLGSVISIKSLNALRILRACINSKSGVSEEEIMEKTTLDNDETSKLISNLCELYLLDADCGSIKWIGDSIAADYIHYLYEKEVKRNSLAEAKTKIAQEKLKEGFHIRSIKIKGKIKEELLCLLKKFNGRWIPKILFRNQDFLAKHNNYEAYRKEGAIKEDDKMSLPQIVGCFNMVGLAEKGFSIIVGHGFNNSRYDDENEIVWIVGMKETPAVVSIIDVERFVRQCNIITSNTKTTAVKRWIIAREGFTGEALKRLSVEAIYTTDAVQLNILKNIIEDSNGAVNPPNDMKSLTPLKEFEVILPISTRAELVAAKAVEEIGINIGLDNNTISQIKTALVEACINAFEHSKVKNSKVYCKFIVGNDKVVVHVENEGKGFDPASKHEISDVVNLVGIS
ncbi:MAG: ATP-binding protein, partial [Deltaproteobacteria bacterium]